MSQTTEVETVVASSQLTARQVELVQQSFARVKTVAEVVAVRFYANLFELDPALRRMFHGDMKRQGQMLMAIMGNAVDALSHPDRLPPLLTPLGRRHVGYGVCPHHYGTVGAALVATLEEGLGELFTVECRGAWLKAFKIISDHMQQAQAGAH